MTGNTPFTTTALKKYARLESTGLWRDGPDAQRREVLVAFRAASLVLMDGKTETPLSHWSLAAVERVNGTALPALYAPDTGEGETLEIDDRDMIEALETVAAKLRGANPRSGRLRSVVLGAGVVGVAALLLFWLPDAVVDHTASVLPPAARLALGQTALAEVTRVTGLPCDSPLGTFALTALSDQLFGAHQAQILILRDGIGLSTHLPGGIILAAKSLVEDADGPEVLAGFAMMERLRAETEDPILPLLRYAGTWATIRLLTTGSLPDGALAGYGEALLQMPPTPVPDDLAISRFGKAGLSTQPFALRADPSATAYAGLIAGDPMAKLVPQPLLYDGDWVSLQDICR